MSAVGCGREGEWALSFHAIIFWALAAMTIVPAIGIVVSKNIVHMAFWLLGTLMGVAGLYLHMEADFLGMTQVFVYIGGINVLLLFGIMLTNREPLYVRAAVKRPAIASAVLLGVVVAVGLIQSYGATEWHTAKDVVIEAGASGSAESMGRPSVKPMTAPGLLDPASAEGVTNGDGTAATLGTYLLSDYILPFEIVSILLLVVLVGAAYIARRDPEGGSA